MQQSNEYNIKNPLPIWSLSSVHEDKFAHFTVARKSQCRISQTKLKFPLMKVVELSPTGILCTHGIEAWPGKG